MERWTTSSHMVHLPCCDCCTAFVTRSLSISLLLSRIISSALIAEQDSDHFAKWFQPKAWRSVWIGPRISSNVSSETDLFISSCALNFLFVLNSGLTSRILMSAELASTASLSWRPYAPPLLISEVALTSRSCYRGQQKTSLEVAQAMIWCICWLSSLTIRLRRSTNWNNHTLNLPYNGASPITCNPSTACLTVSLSWFLSVRELLKTRTRLLTGSSDTLGTRCPATTNETSLQIFPLTRARLLDFACLKVIRHHPKRLLNVSRVFWTSIHH